MTYKLNMQMDERELLELAAKAAGVKAQYSDNMGDFSIGEPYSRGEVRWNPLDNDADALRLAVCIPGLNLQWIIAEARQAHKDHEERCAYVRRAIVNAAAASVMAKVVP